MTNTRSLRQGLSLKARALRALSQRDYTVMELKRKLAEFEGPKDELDAVLLELQEKGFLSDVRTIQSHINRRASKLGLMRIKRELKAKGADSEVLEAELGRLHASELERARQVWAKKYGGQDGKRVSCGFNEAALSDGQREDWSGTGLSHAIHERQAQKKEWGRQIRFLLGRGFSLQIAQQVVGEEDGLE
jgi:regulatory protein